MRLFLALLVAMLLVGCRSHDQDASPSVASDTGGLELIDLPGPEVVGGGSLPAAMAGRRSIRDYRPEPLDLADISQLLWALQGVTSDTGQRTAPSAGATYPLEVYLVTEDGRYHYVPSTHQLEVLGRDDLRRRLSEAALSQEAIETAPAVFVVSAVYARTEQVYGDRAERYVELEAGHACQNLLLQAVSLDLGAVPIGAFHDAQIQEVLGLPADHEPLYLIPVGHPAE